MFSWRKKEANLLCLKYCGKTISLNCLMFVMQTALPSLDQCINDLYVTQLTMSYSLVRKGGTMWGVCKGLVNWEISPFAPLALPTRNER